MERINVWCLIARLVQICFGLIVMGISIALDLDNRSYYYSSSDPVILSATYCSAAVVLFGFFGLFGIKTRPDAVYEAKLFLLLLCIDCWAVMCSIAAGALLWTDVAQYGGYNWSGLEGGTAAAAVLAHLNLLAIGSLIIRTLRLWWKRMLYAVPADPVPQAHTGIEYERHPQYYQQVHHSTPPAHSVEMKNNISRPLSVAEESVFSATTLGYRPSVTEPAQKNHSRTSSQAAPPYTKSR